MSASQLQPRKSGQPDRLADSTPDCLLTASSSWAATARARARAFSSCRSGASRAMSTMPTLVNPGSVPVRRLKDVRNKAETNSTTKMNPTCAATRVFSTPRCPMPRALVRLSASMGPTVDARRAGIRPQSIVVATQTASANVSARRSKCRSSAIGSSSRDRRATMAGARSRPNSMPVAVATTASIPLSTSSCCSSRPRPAPIDTRTAISRSRAAALATSRLATLAHAVSRGSSTPRARPSL
jgi:hypothetical protein